VEFALMLQRLWRLRLPVAVGVLLAALAAVFVSYDVRLSPLSVTSRGSVFGAAQTQVYIDSERPSLVTGQQDSSVLVARAQTVARFVGSGSVRSAVARELGVPVRAITVTGPVSDAPGAQNSQPVAQQRANALLGEGGPLSIYVDTEASAPIVTLFVQARDGAEALRLASTTTRALSEYVERLRTSAARAERARLERQIAVIAERESRRVGPAERRNLERELLAGSTVVRPLGSPVGGDVTDQTARLVTLVVFVVLVVAWCVTLLLLTGAHAAARRRRALRAVGRPRTRA
jgi:hypothetical protein